MDGRPGRVIQETRTAKRSSRERPSASSRIAYGQLAAKPKPRFPQERGWRPANDRVARGHPLHRFAPPLPTRSLSRPTPAWKSSAHWANDTRPDRAKMLRPLLQTKQDTLRGDLMPKIVPRHRCRPQRPGGPDAAPGVLLDLIGEFSAASRTCAPSQSRPPSKPLSALRMRSSFRDQMGQLH